MISYDDVKSGKAAIPATGDDHGLALGLIQIDGGTQSRATLNQHVVDDYAAAIKDGASFPPIVVFYDGKKHWLADGFHRFHAFQKLGRETVAADVRQGTRRDAILHSVGANETHGLRRTNDDKRRAVLTLLNDSVWGKWTDREIGRACQVDHKTVGKIRCDLPGEILTERVYTTKHGTTATMKTAGINASRKNAPEGPQLNDEPSPEVGPQAEASQSQDTGVGTLAGREGRREGEAVSAGLPTRIILDEFVALWCEANSEDREGFIAYLRILGFKIETNSLGMASEGMDRSAVGANAGERHVDSSASRASSAVKVGATNSQIVPTSPRQVDVSSPRINSSLAARDDDASAANNPVANVGEGANGAIAAASDDPASRDVDGADRQQPAASGFTGEDDGRDVEAAGGTAPVITNSNSAMTSPKAAEQAGVTAAPPVTPAAPPKEPKLNPDCQKAARGEACFLSHSAASCSKCASAAAKARKAA